MEPNFDELMVLTGWIGEHPEGGEVAHLLLYPVKEGYAAQIELLANAVGLGPSLGLTASVDPQRCSARLSADGWVHLRIQGEEAAAIPTNPDWIAIARQRGHLMLTMGTRAWDGDPAGLDNYTADPAGFWMGLITITG